MRGGRARRPPRRGQCLAAPLIASLVAGSLAGLTPGRAWCQTPAAPPSAAPAAAPSPSAVERADAAFEEGRQFFDQGRYKEACEKFELSLQLDPSPGTLLNLGNCYEPQGDLVRALETFERAFAEAQRAGDSRRKELWTEAARERIASLSRRVPQVSVRGVPADGRVSIDRRPLERASGVFRINPGRHTVEVSAPGKRTFSREFEIAASQRLAVNVPALETEVASETPSSAPAPGSPGVRDGGGGKQYGPWPYVLGGAGVALLGTSLITGLSANSKQNQLERECDENYVCDLSLKGTQDSAKTLALVTDVFWITGVIAAGVGVTLFVLDANADEPGGTVQAGCFGAGCGLLATGRF
jgi:hypothetical protein